VTTWERIDTWLEANAPDVLAKLRPGATREEISAFEKALGRALPVSLRASYLAHDGVTDEDSRAIFGALRAPPHGEWARYMSWLPLAGAIEQLSFMKGLGEEWPEAHLPIAKDAGGNLVLVDLESGGVLLWDHETWDPEPLAASFDEWLTALADDMDANLVITDEEEDDPDALQLLPAPLPPRAATPAIGPDRPARVLLEALVERRWVDLARDGDLEALIRALVAALAASPKARARKVSDVLEASKSVDELFADDEQIAELVEELG